MFEDTKKENKYTDDQSEETNLGVGSLTPSELKQIRGEESKTLSAPPLSKDFNERMKKLHNKGRKRGKRYSWIGILVSVMIGGAGLYFGYYLLTDVKTITSEIDKKNNQSEKKLASIEDPDNICAGDYCCLASLKKINRSGFSQVDRAQECESGFIMKQLDCEESLKWCEPISENNKTTQAVTNLSEWISYQDIKEGYQFRHPPQFEITQNPLATSTKTLDSFSLFDPDIKRPVLEIMQTTITLNEWLSQTVSQDYLDRHHIPEEFTQIKDVFSVNDITIGKINGKKYEMIVCLENDCETMNTLLWEKDNAMFVFKNPKSDEALVRQILNTWQFTSDMDEDQDGLTNQEEDKYGTDKNNPDTDGDGFSDGEEVINGFNPLSEG